MFTYTSPVAAQDPNRPTPYENRGFPYHELDPRRYEELVYGIYRNELGMASFSGFDSISLLSGTRDQGMDCVLIRNQLHYGLIQCKRYDRNLSIDDIGTELTKFALYYLRDNRLIHDVSDFTYFIASSKGFDNKCIAYLNHFNAEICIDTKLEKWISNLLKTPALQQLAATATSEKVRVVLQQFKIKMIGSTDMDELLISPKNASLVDLYFKVRSVTDEQGILRIEDKLDRILTRRHSPEEIISELSRGSTTVSSEKNNLEGIHDSHIERTETAELLHWLDTPCEMDPTGRAKNLCLLAANAGMGKTVIIRDTYDKLTEMQVPVLAVKADKVYAGSMRELQEKIGLGIPIHQLIDQCLESFPKVVILIDQIDALSLSISANRDAMSIYTQLLSIYKGRENVRIIISVRFFDLYYDRRLRVFKDLKTVEVAPLSREMVIGQLEKLGLREKNLSAALLSLLQVPNNLDVFSRIYPSKGRFSEIHSVQDLYGELYRQKILRPLATAPDVGRLKQLLEKMTARMYASQQITQPEMAFEEYATELDYLKSERILKSENGQLQFFHQTFYDYLYAKGFTAKKISIMTFINRSDQSMMIRPGLKMILNFTRETDPELYERYLHSILRTGSMQFHIKHLVITMLAAERSPKEPEKSIFLAQIATHFDFFAVFCEHMMGDIWLKLLLEKKMLHLLTVAEPEKERFHFDSILERLTTSTKKRRENLGSLTDILGQMLRRNIHGNEQLVLGFCDHVQDTQTVRWLLFNNRDWKKKIAIRLFEKCFPTGSSDHHGFFMVLENIATVDPIYAFEKIKGSLTILDRERNTPFRKERNSKLLETLMERIPELFLDHITQTVVREEKSLTEDVPDGGILSIYNVKDVMDKQVTLHDTDNIYKLLAVGLKKQAAGQTPYFYAYLRKHLSSRYSSILSVIAFALKGNEALYPAIILELFEHMKRGNAFNRWDEPNKAMQQLLKAVAPLIDAQQLDELASAMLDIKAQEDFTRYGKTTPTGPMWGSVFGLTTYKYMKCLPEQTIAGNKTVKKRFGELERKFGRLEKDHNYFGPRRTPLKESAYDNMDFDNWVNSMLKYNGIRQTSDTPLGGLHEHSEKFGETIKKDIEGYLPLIKETIFNEKIHLAYSIKSLQALSEKGLEICGFVKHVISRNPERMELYYLLNLCGKLISAKPDQEIFNFVISNARPTLKQSALLSEDDVFHRNKLENQERASNALMRVRDKKYGHAVFTAIEEAMKESEGRVKKFIMVNSAYLLELDAQRTMSLFTANMEKIDTAKKLNANAWSLSFLIHHGFGNIAPLFERALCFDDQTEMTAQNVINLLMSGLYNGYTGARELFWQFFQKSEECKSQALSNAFEYFYTNGSVEPVNLEILHAALASDSKKVRHRFKIKFLHIEHIEFPHIEKWLFAYAGSESFVLSDYFLEYLTKNSALHPKQCTDIFEMAIRNRSKFSDPETNEMRSDESTTKFIVGTFNALPGTEKKYRSKLMKMFDRTLRDLRFRKNAENVLDKILD